MFERRTASRAIYRRPRAVVAGRRATTTESAVATHKNRTTATTNAIATRATRADHDRVIVRWAREHGSDGCAALVNMPMCHLPFRVVRLAPATEVSSLSSARHHIASSSLAAGYYRLS